MFIMRKSQPAELVGAFTPTETDRITSLRQEFQRYPDQFKLDISIRRMEFARWLMAHGYLDEWRERHLDHPNKNMLHLNPDGACDPCVPE